MENQSKTNTAESSSTGTKFCSSCGKSIAKEAVICPQCGCRAGSSDSAQPQIIINNSNQNQNNAAMSGLKPKNKWISLLLCLFTGVIGGHKFYEGKIGMGILYIFTAGLFGIGVIIDFFSILFKPKIYYV